MRTFSRLLLLTGLALGAVTAPATAADRFALAGGCYAMQAADSGRFVVRDGSAWRASAASANGAEAFRLQPAALGRNLLMARDGSFLIAGAERAGVSATPSFDGDFRFTEAAGDRFALAQGDRRLGTAGDGTLTSAGAGSSFAFVRAERCAAFPEAEVNVTGTPGGGPTPFGEAKGLIETHLHGMAFEFLGGAVHCGRPWSPLGITVAMVDCPDHGPNGQTGALENVQSSGNPAQGHATDGWPTFKGWPTFRSYTHEQVYYKWLERAWRGGLRMYTNLLVDNEVLCEVYPLRRRENCNEMDGVRLQRKRLDELVDYIDAQSGGPGKGWLRIVRTPFEAREVVNAGKLALVVGIEVSKLFDCGEVNGRPTCDRQTIDRQLEEVHALGVRQMQLVNKNDNGLSGVAGDAGSTGVLTNTANKQDTGHFWDMQSCPAGARESHDHDREQATASEAADRDALAGAIIATFLPTNAAPFYPPAPHCNAAGLTDLGAYLIRRMMAKGMLVDPDHMSVVARDQALSLIEARRYGGIMSSHSWSTPDSYRRILASGGIVTPASKNVLPFIEAWKELKPGRNSRFRYGIGFSTDMNGFASQGGPREGNAANPVKYPFKSLDGSTSIDRQRTGEQVYDINEDGTAHFGLYPDLIEDVRVAGGPEIAKDLLGGAEAYLQMWERAAGVPGPACRAAARRFTTRGLGEIRLGEAPEALLRRAGQPDSRPGRLWTWCVGGTRGGSVKALLTPQGRVELVSSTAPFHRFDAVGKGSSVRGIARRTTPLGSRLRVGRAGTAGNRVVFGVRRGRVTFTAIASRRTAASPTRLRAALRAAGLR